MYGKPKITTNLRRLGVEKLAQRLCAEHHIDYEITFARRGRDARCVRARDHLIALLRWSTGMSLVDIATIFDMDHSSVMSAIRRHEERINSRAFIQTA